METTIAADISAGAPNAYPDDLTVYNDTLYFRANDGANGTELWKFNGNAAVLAADISPTGSSYPEDLTVYDGELYFKATDEVNGYELWKYDGTSASMVADIVAGAGSFVPNNLTVYNDSLYFSATDGSMGYELWKYNGTSISQVQEINPGTPSSSPSFLIVHSGKLFFRANNGSNGYELWEYDGISATRIPGMSTQGSSSPGSLTEYNGDLYFRANDGVSGSELWKYDGVSASLVADIFPGANSGSPFYLTVYNDTLYFRAYEDTYGYELWKYNGTTTSLVQDFYPGLGYFNPRDLTVYMDTLYFGGSNGTQDELWKYDGTTISLAADINPSSSSNPKHLTVYNDTLYFQAANEYDGAELWKYDGTTASMVADIHSSYGSAPQHLTVYHDTLYFSANDGVSGTELWKYNGTTVSLAADIAPGSGYSYPTEFAIYQDTLYFRANDGTHGNELWKFDGTTASMVADIFPGSNYSNPSELTSYEGRLYFRARSNGSSVDQLWQYDGSEVTLASDISYPSSLLVHDDALFFSALTPATGYELFSLSDDTSMPCDDGLDCTFDDVIQADCSCLGTALFSELQKAHASIHRSENDYFGFSTGISGDKIIVGAYLEDEDLGVGNTLDGAGAAYFQHRHDDGLYYALDKLVASDRGVGDNFGFSVDISGDYAIVGARFEDEDTMGANTLSDAGSAYIFEMNGGQLVEAQKLVASDRGAEDRFGISVSISGDLAVVGAYREDEDAISGSTVSDAGSVYVFLRDTSGTWIENQKLVASDRSSSDQFGWQVDISGHQILVGANQEDEDSVGMNTLAEAGAAYVFEYDTLTASWVETAKLVASDRAADDLFGYAVSISGDYALVGAYAEDEDTTGGNTLAHAGSAYMFEKNESGGWTEVQKLVSSDRAADDRFGVNVSVSGNRALIGAFWEDEDAFGTSTLSKAGSAYLFTRSANGEWHETQKLVASDRAIDDSFGRGVAIDGETAIIGAYLEDELSNGSATLTNAGSAYFFEACCTTPPTAVCQDVTVYLYGDGTYPIDPAALDGGSTSNCYSSVTLATLPNVVTCADVGSPVIITLTVGDASEPVLKSTCTASVTVLDTILPEVMCQDVTVQLDESGIGTLTPADLDMGTTLMFADTPAIGFNARSTAVGDVDGDGLDDIVTTPPGKIYLNQGDGTFTDLGSVFGASNNSRILLTELNGDTHPDLVIITNGSSSYARLNSGVLPYLTFNIGLPIGTDAIEARAADFNGDGHTDLVVPGTSSTRFLLNNGNNTFTNYFTHSSSERVAIADMDGDADPDVVSLGGPPRIFVNDGSGGFAPTSMSFSGGGPPVSGITDIEIADLDGDGHLDIYATVNGGQGDRVMLNDSSGTSYFSSFASGSPNPVASTAVSLFDVDNDGDQDALVTNTSGPDQLWLNDGSGLFSDSGLSFDPSPNAPNSSHTLSLIDADQDGDKDAVIGYGAGSNALWINESYLGFSDNCDIATQVLSQEIFTCMDVDTHSVTLTVTDYNGNSSSCEAMVVVQDSAFSACCPLPTVSCHDTTLYISLSNEVHILPADILQDSTICGFDTVFVFPDTVSCGAIGETMVTLYMIDVNQDTAICTATVTLLDTIVPVSIATDTTIYLDGSGTASLAPNALDSGSSDNCGISSVTLSRALFTCSDLDQLVQVTQTVTDASGNMATALANVIVLDTIPPQAQCQDVTVQLGARGEAVIFPGSLDNASTDVCGIMHMELSQDTFTCDDLTLGPQFWFEFGDSGSGSEQFFSPRGTAMDVMGNLFVCDFDRRKVLKFDSDGVFVLEFGVQGTGIGEFQFIQHIAIDIFGNCYIADWSRKKILKFTGTGMFISEFGIAGSGVGQFDTPIAVAVGGSGHIYVAENNRKKIIVFDSTGTFLHEFGTTGTAVGQMQTAYFCTVDASENVYVSDISRLKVLKFDSSGTFLHELGTTGSNPGDFSGLRNIALMDLKTFTSQTMSERRCWFSTVVQAHSFMNMVPQAQALANTITHGE